jgi:hypothetical protein
MKHVIATGTDAASVCLFDPSALPDDFDERVQEGPIEMLEQLAAQGRLWWCNTGGDGGYLFHVYADADVPDEVRPYLRDPHHAERFQIPSGTLWACGAEYVARDPVRGNANSPKGGLGKFSHMGGPCAVVAGDYAMTAWRAEWPQGLVERELEKQLGSSTAKAGNRLGVSTGVVLFAAFGLSIVTLGLTIGALRNFRERLGELAIWWTVLIALWAVAVRLMKAMTRQENNPLRREAEHRFPSIVVQLQKLPQ